MQTDLYRALRPHIRSDQLSPHVVWDALDDDLRDACADGCLMMLRDLPAEVPHSVQMLIDIIGFWQHERAFHSFESRPGACFALVLKGWRATTIRVRSSSVTLYIVQAFGGRPEAGSESQP